MGIILAATTLGQVAGTSIATYIGYAPWAVLIGIIGGIVMVIRARKQASAYNNIGMEGPYGNAAPAYPQPNQPQGGILSQATSFITEKFSPSRAPPQYSYPPQQPPPQNDFNAKVDNMANGQPQGQQQGQPQSQAQVGMISMNNTVNLPVSIWAANVINTLAKKHKRTETSIIDQLCEYYLNTKGQGGQQGGGQQQGGGRSDNTKALMQGLGRMSNDFMNGTGFWK